MLLSVVVPSFNEEKRLPETLEKIEKYLSQKPFAHEIIVVDDGSTDRTFQVAEGFKSKCPSNVTVIKNEANSGKGFSVKRGILASKGELVLFSDADLSTPIEELEKLSKYVQQGYDVVIGSRAKDGAFVRVKQSWHRQTMGRIFNLFVKTILLKNFSDTQCGFKLFKGDVARRLAAKLAINGFCFDVELLYLALKNGHKVKEVGIAWDNSPGSKVKVIKSSVGMFIDLFKIKRIHRRAC